MTDETTDAVDFQREFWTGMRRMRTGLLAVRNGEAEHVAPMTAHFDGQGPVFFYAPADGVLATHIAEPHGGRWFYADPHHHLFASAEATLAIEADPAMRARFWSDEVEAWFPGGPDQVDVAMIRCTLGEAQVWLGGESHPGPGAARDRRAHVDL